MAEVIVWADDAGYVVAATPFAGMTLDEFIASPTVPKDRPHWVKDAASLPSQSALTWVVDTEGNVTSDPSRAPVPARVLRSNFIRVLDDNGLLDQVLAAVDAADNLTKQLWLSPEFERNSTMLIGMATQMGLADQLDDLFRAAGALPA